MMAGKFAAAAMVALPFASVSLPATAQVPTQSGPVLLHPMFQSHGVLQRERPIAIRGQALPGETVDVALGEHHIRAQADTSGHWRAVLPAMTAGGPYTLTAATPRGARQTLTDIMIGDVWLCSGQSNMEFEVYKGLNPDGEIAGATDDGIRLFTIDRAYSPTPMESFTTPVAWEIASPASVGAFSAACYFMGRDLRGSQKVPIGLIDASWGGTAIDAWRPERVLARDPDYREALDSWSAYRRDPTKGAALWGVAWQDWWRRASGDLPGTEPWSDAPGGEWLPVPAFTVWEDWGVPALARFDGILFYTTQFTLTEAQAGQAATLRFGAVDDVDQSWINGKSVGSTFSWNQPRNYALGPDVLRPGANRLTIAAIDTGGGGGLSGGPESRALTFADGSSVPLDGEWRYRVAPANIGMPPSAPWDHTTGLSGLYNGMIAPIGEYGLKGVAWYQGEADAGNPRPYARKLLSMMGGWREQFGTPELPFLIVSLAGFGPRSAVPTESGFADIREQQRRATDADPNAALAIAVDLGDVTDIHPGNKQDVGHRLARAARSLAYGSRESPSGPAAISATQTDAGVRVRFAGVSGRLLSYSAAAPFGFELCDATPRTCRFVPARIEGDSVILDPGAGPAARVRFCWGGNPVCNLYDEAALPTGPFELPVD